MQYPFSCTPGTLQALYSTLSQARIGRYLPTAGGDSQLALRTYLWNARLCQEFYAPTQLAEVALRNTLAKGLERRFGSDWHNTPGLVAGLPDMHKRKLRKAIDEEFKLHGTNLTAGHVVSALPLGFWVHMLSATPRKIVWKGSFAAQFPHLPVNVQEQDVHLKVDKFRKFRNRVAHHNAIFDKKPMKQLQNIQDIVSWICPDTLWLMKQVSNPALVISQRPVI